MNIELFVLKFNFGGAGGPFFITLKRYIMKLTLCGKDLDLWNNDIPTIECLDIKKLEDEVKEWLDVRQFGDTVLVAFLSYRGLQSHELRNEQYSFIVSHSTEDVESYIINVLEVSDKIEDEDIKCDLCIFEFENYQEAFKYCADLKESF